MIRSRNKLIIVGVCLALILVALPSANAGTSKKSPWWVWSSPATTQDAWASGLVTLYAASKAPASATTGQTTPPPEDASLSASPRSEKGATAHPTSIPILDPDFMPNFSLEPRYLDPQTYLQIHGPETHVDSTGRGVRVAVLDCGINTLSPYLRGHVSAYSYDAVDRDMDPNDFGNGIDDDGNGLIDECRGHGTFVAGMVLLAAPDAEILFIRVGDDEGRIDDQALVRGLKWARWTGAQVINLSLRVARDDQDTANQAIRDAEAAGIVVVTSAGNYDQKPMPYVEGSLLVGAVDSRDVEADFTSYSRGQNGSASFVYAPGVNVHGPIGAPRNDSVAWWSGTSFSTGIVSGAAALLLEAHPEFDLFQRIERLSSATEPVIRKTGQVHMRAGRIDLAQVIR